MRKRLRLGWRQKALLFRVLRLLPDQGDGFQYFVRRRLSHSLPRTDHEFIRALDTARQHVHNLYGSGSRDGLYFEFGAGWDIFQNLALYCFGVERQWVVDLAPLLRPELANDAIGYLSRCPGSDFVRRPAAAICHDFRADLKRYGIEYQAPADARKLPLGAETVRAIATTNTLEHIPPADLAAILAECRRVCRPDARMSMRIDYSDHYAHVDSSITRYNFLRFTEREWRRYNPPNHFQNRMRHSEYVQLFAAAGFEIIGADVFRPVDWHERLASVPRESRYAAMADDDVAIVDALISARPK